MNHKMKNLFGILLILFFSVPALMAQKLDYTVSFDADNRYVLIQLKASGLTGDSTLFRMPVWAPGYYLILDYPKHLTGFRANRADGLPLDWQKSGKDGWLIQHPGTSEVELSYRVFANNQSVAESKINSERAFLAPNGLFLYVDEAKELPVTLTIRPDERWSEITTGLAPVPDAENCWFAPDADRLYDSPLLLGNQQVIRFELDNRQYELALETPDGIEETTFVADLQKMITQAIALFGEAPFQHYAFLLMGKGGGGLEHLNSQACFTSGSFRFANEADYRRFLSFITHEFYHLYNVKAIRPVEFEPFDYGQEVFTPMLWVSEGLTVYYESVILRRAGLITPQQACETLGRFIRTVESREGNKAMSLRESSYDIWLHFFNRNANRDDVIISYYDKGPILGLLLDIAIRQASANRKSLDDVMRTLYQDWYKTAGRGFTEEEFWAVCAETAGDPLTEIRSYVDTTTPIDYDRYLGYAGLQLDADYTLRLTKCEGLAKAIQQSIF